MALSSTRGYQIHRNRLKRMARIKEPVLRALVDAAEVIREDAQQSIIAGSVSGAGHVPSAPYTPPNRDSGNLDLGIDVRVNPGGLTVSVISTAPYAAVQELGSSRQLPRPYLRPALHRNKNRLLMGIAMAASGEGVRIYKGDQAFNNSRARYENGG